MSKDEKSPPSTEENVQPPPRLNPSIAVLVVPFFLIFLMVQLILVSVIGVGILTTSGKGIVKEKHMKFKGTPSIQFESGETISAVGVFYAIERGDNVKKESGSFIYEINNRPVNAWYLYILSLVRFTFLPVVGLMFILIIFARFFPPKERKSEPRA